MELIIYADESESRGRYFSNFFGGALVSSTDLAHVTERLAFAKREQNLHGEIKWIKVTQNYLEKYKAVMDAFFDLVQESRIKVRIMFTANRHVPQDLTAEQRQNKYFLLYYQFLKHAFGLQYATAKGKPIRCRFYLDALPDTRERVAQFKGFLKGLERTSTLRGHIEVAPEQIADVRSHDHVVMQCLDVVLGAMHFRLNNKHEDKPPGQRTRGKRTIAKDKLYRHINRRIRAMYPNFNVGITTGGGAGSGRWLHPYRHWQFVPRNFEYDGRYEKP